MPFDRYLVAPREFAAALEAEDSQDTRTVPLCASWFLPNDPDKRSGFATYKEQRIPGARFFDLDAIKDNISELPHMLPGASEFAKAMNGLGITNEDRVIVYDTKELGIFSAPRVAWMFKVMGHEKVHVLNNFKLWVDQGLPTESGDVPAPTETRQYLPSTAATVEDVVGFDEMKSLIQEKRRGKSSVTVIDARPSGRFHGSSPEPRPGLPSGHMPGSVSIPFMDVLDPVAKTILEPSQLQDVFKSRGIDRSASVVSSCGTGVSAAVIDLALAEAQIASRRRIYDGSWTEWAQRVRDADDLIHKTS